MTTVGLIMAGLAVAFGTLAVRDIRAGDVGFVIATLRKWEHPVPFWGFVAVEIVTALMCALVAISAFTIPATCDETDKCTVVIQLSEPAP